jgi:L-xylulokinase
MRRSSRAWLETHEPAALDRAERAMFCQDYLRFRLTGALGLEISELSSGALIDQGLRRFTPAALDRFGLGRYARLFGEGVEPLTIFGAATAQAAAETGLAAGTPVSAGYADGPAMALGLGAIDESLISVIAGAWGLDQLVSRSPVADGSISTPIVGPRPGEFVLADAAPTSASAFEWFVDSVVSAADPSHRDHSALFRFCDEQAARAQGGDDAPYFLPYLNGRLDQPEARGCFVGLASWRALPEMIRAIFEGVAFERRRHIDRLLKGRARPRAARFAGGAARSRPWLDIFAAAIDMPLELAAAERRSIAMREAAAAREAERDGARLERLGSFVSFSRRSAASRCAPFARDARRSPRIGRFREGRRHERGKRSPASTRAPRRASALGAERRDYARFGHGPGNVGPNRLDRLWRVRQDTGYSRVQGD